MKRRSIKWIIVVPALVILALVVLYLANRITDSTMNILANICFFILGAALLVFVIGYTFIARQWLKTSIGFAVWFTNFSFFFVWLSICLNLTLGQDYFGRPAVRLLAFTLPCFAVVNKTRVLFLLQVKGYRKRYEEKHHKRLL